MQCVKARKFAEDRNWQVVAEFKDDHTSAFRMVDRKGFDALLAAAEAGMIDAIVARHHDRLTRNLKDYDRLIEVCRPSRGRGALLHGWCP
jgi:site-specific DNA recombinase